MEQIGTGKGVAALFNARAKQVTPRVVRAFTRALPDATVLVSEDLVQARRHADRLVAEKPEVVFAGGGDGSIVQLLNLLRAAGATRFPTLGTFMLGTGNAWSRVLGARDYFDTMRALPFLPRPLPTRRFDLVEVDGTLCHFAGVGWDARMLNDYLRNLDKRSSALIGSRFSTRLHKGLFGYLYVLFRTTVPEETALVLREGQARVTVENLDDEAYTLDAVARQVALTGPAARILYEGPVSVGAAGTCQEWGFGFKAFPFAQAKPGYLNIRVYDRKAIDAARVMFRLWRGNFPEPGMHDYYSKRVLMRFSRPMPFQVGGDGVGPREQVEFRVGDTAVDLVDWQGALPE